MKSDIINSRCSPLDCTTSVIADSTPPVIVVGLPRSGSSFLSHVMSSLDDWYVFDDLYPFQKALALGADPFLSPQQMKTFVDQLCWAARARIRWEKHFRAPNCTWDDIDRMEYAVCSLFESQTVTWPQVLEEWMTRLALHHGCQRWGYKTPQDFMNLDVLAELFPGARFVFIMRDPRTMMASMKNLEKRKGGDGDPRQYHPIAYSLYWDTAYKKVNEFIATGKAVVHIIQFEEFIKNPDRGASVLAGFLDTTMTEKVIVKGTNSSFKSSRRQNLTPTETWVCEWLAGANMQRAGYRLSQSSPRLRDMPDLARTSLQFVIYQLQRMLQSKQGRVSIKAYLQTILKASFRPKTELKAAK